eukprot:jgi/Ulvmu1/6838/UM031_0043.1
MKRSCRNEKYERQVARGAAGPSVAAGGTAAVCTIEAAAVALPPFARHTCCSVYLLFFACSGCWVVVHRPFCKTPFPMECQCLLSLSCLPGQENHSAVVSCIHDTYKWMDRHI